MHPLPLSVVIIAMNAQRTLKICLESLQDFEEIVIVDGGSKDETKKIASSFSNVSYYENPWPGFIPQRNFSLEKAKHPWCLMMDSDERCTPQLVSWIKENLFLFTKENPIVLYRIMRTEYFDGFPIEVGLGRSNYQERLLKKERVRYTGGNHHRHLIDGKEIHEDHPLCKNLPGEIRILHDAEYNLDHWLFKFPRFTILCANEKIQQGRRTSLWEIFFTFPLVFIQQYRKSYGNKKTGVLLSLLEAINKTMIKIYIYNKQNLVSSGNYDPRKVMNQHLG